MPPLHGRGKIVVLDGGLGTTLEIIYGKKIADTPLWSAKPIIEDPESIIQAHLSFLNAGARIIQTSTYQCAFETFERAGYSRADAEAVMLKSVVLANEARNRFVAAAEADVNIGIALSLGPFGATVTPSGEFNGFYPPPYGPMAASGSPNGNGRNGFEDEAETERSIDVLARFHFERLGVFARSREVWEMVDYVAFETVPLVREVRAIRRAMGRLQREIVGESGELKAWWISCTFPDGLFPEIEGDLLDGGRRVQVRDVVRAVLGLGSGDAEVVPTGIGVNCTPLRCLPGLLRDMAQARAVEGIQGESEDEQKRAMLVVYPGGDDSGRKWAEELGCIAKSSATLWHGVIVGGCCMTGPPEIEQLGRNVGV